MITYPLVAFKFSWCPNWIKTSEERQSATPLSLVLSGPEAPRLATRLGWYSSLQRTMSPPGGRVMFLLKLNPSTSKRTPEAGKVDLWINVPNGFTKELAELIRSI